MEIFRRIREYFRTYFFQSKKKKLFLSPEETICPKERKDSPGVNESCLACCKDKVIFK